MALCLKHKGNYSDEFWMFSFKVVPCTKTYAHSWSSCPCAHPGETARRRDSTQFNYQPVLCPNVKSKAGCPAGDTCGYAHNVFEQWLHPQRYKALMCTYGSQCTRPSCFFAHSLDELRVPWKGNTGSTSGGDQQQQQENPLKQQQQQQVDAPAAGLLNQGMGLGANGSTAQGVDFVSDAGESLSAGGHGPPSVVSMAASGGGASMLMACNGSRGGGGSARQLLMVHPVNVQQQLPGAMPPRVGGGGSGSGSHSVVDVRVMAGARAATAAMAKPLVPVVMGGAGSTTDLGPPQLHSLTAYAAQPPGAQQQSIRRPPLPPSQTHSSQRSGNTAVTTTGTPSQELDTSTVTIDGSGLTLGQSLPHHGPSGSSLLYRAGSNPASGNAIFMSLVEESPFASAACIGGGSVSGSILVPGAGALGLGLASSNHAHELSFGSSESPSTASLYTTPTTTQSQVMVSGLASLGLFSGTGSVGDTGQVGTSGSSGAGGGGGQVSGGRSLHHPAPQNLQQHLQQLHHHHHQQQQALLHHQHQQQQQAQVRTGGSGGGTAQTGAGQQAYQIGRAQGTGSQQQQQAAVGQQHAAPSVPYRAAMTASSSGGSAGWAPQHPPAPSHHPGAPGGGGGTVDMLSSANSTSCCGSLSQCQDLCAQPQSTTMGDLDDTMGLGPTGDTLVMMQSRSSTGSRDSSSALTGSPYPHHPPQRTNKQQQSKPAGQMPMVGGPGGSREGLHAAAGGPATGPSRHGEAGTEQAVRSQLQQLQLSAALGGDQHQHLVMSGLSLRQQLSTTPPSGTSDNASNVAASAATSSAVPQLDPDVEMLLLSSLQLQLSHAGLAGHPVVSSFPARDWLRQALQGRSQEATRAFLLDLLSHTMPVEQIVAVRRLLECLDGAGVLLSCFAGPTGGASAVGPGVDMAATSGAGSASGAGSLGAGSG